MKVIFATLANMPISPAGLKIRYEIVLKFDGTQYHVMFYQFVSDKMYKSKVLLSTESKQYAIEFYNGEVVVLTSIYEKLGL